MQIVFSLPPFLCPYENHSRIIQFSCLICSSILMENYVILRITFHTFLSTSFLFMLFFYCNTRFQSYSSFNIKSSTDTNEGCSGIYALDSYKAKCHYLISNSQCNPEGYIDYLHIFYCTCGNHPILGYCSLILWLILLFYLLGNTAASYFCSNLEGLSKLLKLSPTIAGVTLLSLGNGAPDVFSTIVSFSASTSTNLVGINCILGGAFFVSTVVVGTISICIASKNISIDKYCFVRDVCFLAFVLLILLAILAVGKISLLGAVAFCSLYFVYVALVSFPHFFRREGEEISCNESDIPVLPIKAELCTPLITKKSSRLGETLSFLELPLYLPRRITIPDISGDKWSKPFAVISVTCSPILLAALWNSKEEKSSPEKTQIIYMLGCVLGAVFGAAAMVTTEKETPPKRFLFAWLASGFLMSVTWTYIVAEELVSLLVSFGVILHISPSILGLTVLAWGNSVGDLMANVAVAMTGGSSGVQVAVSGCYGGPIFNVLVGLGVSFVVSNDVPRAKSVFQTLGFLVVGLVWALVVLPRRSMKLDRVLGVGLISIYLCFLFVSFGFDGLSV